MLPALSTGAWSPWRGTSPRMEALPTCSTPWPDPANGPQASPRMLCSMTPKVVMFWGHWVEQNIAFRSITLIHPVFNTASREFEVVNGTCVTFVPDGAPAGRGQRVNAAFPHEDGHAVPGGNVLAVRKDPWKHAGAQLTPE